MYLIITHLSILNDQSFILVGIPIEGDLSNDFYFHVKICQWIDASNIVGNAFIMRLFMEEKISYSPI